MGLSCSKEGSDVYDRHVNTVNKGFADFQKTQQYTALSEKGYNREQLRTAYENHAFFSGHGKDQSVLDSHWMSAGNSDTS